MGTLTSTLCPSRAGPYGRLEEGLGHGFKLSEERLSGSSDLMFQNSLPITAEKLARSLTRPLQY
ncbi:hypothetical protein WG66_009666 [Moniliophthora roreri]|nr:hypothetical protein WG66_009666 [Moniliophthora roreri]